MVNNTLNYFLENISIKKQHINKLKLKVTYLNSVKNQEHVLKALHLNKCKKTLRKDYLVKYILDITFSRTNTLLHVMDFSGNLKVFYSAGQLQYNGKKKRSRRNILKEFYKILVLKLKFLRNQPLVLNLKNVNSSKFWILKLLKKKFFVKVLTISQSHPYNGCRKKKLKRKKFRTKSNKSRPK